MKNNLGTLDLLHSDMYFKTGNNFQLDCRAFLTRRTTSLAAITKMSAQETTPGHFASTACLAFITVSNPSPARERLSGASFSASPFGDAIMIDASQPYKPNQSKPHTMANYKLVYSF